MSAPAGWYPDPGGQPGLFRFWDGSSWSATTTRNPAVPPPATAPLGARPQPGSGPVSSAAAYARPRRSPAGWIVAAVVGVVVIVLVLVGARALTRTGDDPGPVGPTVANPTSAGSSPAPSDVAVCPPVPSSSPYPSQSRAARVTSGKISYPTLAAPYGAPHPDSRVPFGRAVQVQDHITERNSVDDTGWAASVLIATLSAGDGFYGPEQGAKLVARCITATFYGDNAVDRRDRQSAATVIDGHQAWLIEAHLSYDIPGLEATGELLLVAVIDTGDGNAGLFYASVPDNAPTLVAPARKALAELSVG